MARPAGAILLALSLLPLPSSGHLAAQASAREGRAWYGLQSGLLRRRLVDEAVSPLRYAGSDLPLRLQAGRAGPAAAWDMAFELRHTSLSRGTGGAGSGDDRRLMLRAAWIRSVAGSPGAPLVLRLGLAAEGRAGTRAQAYPIDTRRYTHLLVDVAPLAALEHARPRDALTLRAELPAVALALQAYGAGVWRPWTVRRLGRDYRAGRLALDWWHRLGPEWALQLGYREELLRLGEAPVLAETARGLVAGLAYRPGRLP